MDLYDCFDLVILFYDELMYVKSGFQVVATFLSKELCFSEQELFEWMWERLRTQMMYKILCKAFC
jgi:hypothetical protein